MRCSIVSPAIRPLRSPALVLISLLALVLARPSAAAWQPDGVPLSPMPVGSETNSFRGVAPDGSGGAYVVWEFREYLPNFDGESVAWRAQRVDQNGNRPAPWPAAGSMIKSWATNSSFGTFSMIPVGLYPDGSGGAVLAAADQTFIVEPMTLLRLFHIEPGGATTAIPIQNSSFGGYPANGADADGDGAGGAVMIVNAQTFAPPPGPRPPSPLFASRVDATGLPLWPAGSPDVVMLNTPGETGNGVDALSDGAGGGFFAWIDLREPGDPDVYVQHVDATGATTWPDGGVLVCGAAGDQVAPRLVRDNAGGVLVVWSDDRSGVRRIFAHHVLADGTLDPGVPADGRQLPSSDASDTFVNLAADAQGGCFVARSSGISHLHRLDSAALPRPGWPAEGIALNTQPPISGAIGLSPDGLGGTFVSYRNGFGNIPPQGLYAQHFAGNGGYAPGWSAGGYRLSGTGWESALVGSGNAAIAVWNDVRNPYHGVYAQRLLTDGPVPAQLALVNASATVGRVALRWYSADGAGMSATLERRTVASDWARLTEITADGSGHIVYDDAAVTPGVRYGYRMVWQDGSITRTGGEAWVTVPRESQFALEAPSPNPARGQVTLAVTLPDGSGARLDVLDLSGRRVASRDLTGLGAGRHVVALPEVEGLPAGLYVLQVTHAGVAQRARLVRVD